MIPENPHGLCKARFPCPRRSPPHHSPPRGAQRAEPGRARATGRTVQHARQECRGAHHHPDRRRHGVCRWRRPDRICRQERRADAAAHRAPAVAGNRRVSQAHCCRRQWLRTGRWLRAGHARRHHRGRTQRHLRPAGDPRGRDARRWRHAAPDACGGQIPGHEVPADRPALQG